MYTVYSLSVILLFCFYLHYVQIEECSYVLFDKTILQVYQKDLPNIKIQEQTAYYYDTMNSALCLSNGKRQIFSGY